MKIPLSNRLLACCGYVNPGDRVADVGCDHGYLGIYLLKNGIASAVIASDVREMPLQSAIRNAEKFGVKERMSFYLSDGIRDVPREFDCMVCAGMGADTMMSILDAAPWLKSERYRLILQCQSKRSCAGICTVRATPSAGRRWRRTGNSSTPSWRWSTPPGRR